MTKADLVDLIYERVGSPKKEAGEVVEAAFAIIRESLRHSSKGRTQSPDRRPYHHLFPAGAILQAESDPQGSGQQRLAPEVTTGRR
jgi:hypothetical protein